jgi:lipopolysaccharide export LptBFGC system permease protein LptF
MRMLTIDRYIIGSFLRAYLILVAVGLGVYIVSDLLVNLDGFIENRELNFTEIINAIFDYYYHNLPLYFSQLAGPVMTFAGAFTLAMMLRNNEMTALVSAGMPLQRLAAPVFVCAALLVSVWMVNREFILPAFAPDIARDRRDVIGLRTRNIDFARDDNEAILRAGAINVSEGRLEHVVIVEPKARGSHIIEADAATYDPQRKTWLLEGGRRIVESAAPEDPGSLQFGIRRAPVSEYPFTLTPQELLLRQSTEWSGMLSLREMNELVHSRNLPNLASIVMNRHIWLTQPLLQILLLALTVPFFLRREPYSVLVAGGQSLLLSGAFYATGFCAHSMIAAQHAALVAWIPILIFGPVAALLLSNTRT